MRIREYKLKLIPHTIHTHLLVLLSHALFENYPLKKICVMRIRIGVRFIRIWKYKFQLKLKTYDVVLSRPSSRTFTPFAVFNNRAHYIEELWTENQKQRNNEKMNFPKKKRSLSPLCLLLFALVLHTKKNLISFYVNNNYRCHPNDEQHITIRNVLCGGLSGWVDRWM